MDLLNFDEAIKQANDINGKIHALLGNGFSRALFNDEFNYTGLFDRAKSYLSTTAQKSFAALNTTNFEEVMRGLRHASELIDIYASSVPSAAEAMKKDLDDIRESLVKTIALSHPDRPHDITLAQYKSCKVFLSNFSSIYTCNYDLLLYWTVMQDEIKPSIHHDDGFRQASDANAQYVVWDVQNSDAQNIHYLHGGLHIYDAGHELQKYTWVKTNIPLIEQIRSALKVNKYPVFVSEGTWQEKLARIQHSNYLGRSYRSFAKIGGSLFIFGLSLAPNDEHILVLIDRNKVKNLFVGVFGDPKTSWNKTMIQRALKLGKARQMKVQFYDAASALVWDRPV